MLNHCIVMGRLTAAPELKMNTRGQKLCRFTVAVQRRSSNDTDFIDAVCYGQTAEYLCANFAKGAMLWIEGALQQEIRTSKNGGNERRIVISAAKVGF